ncbi:nucleotide pyrophosphohydrolase [Nitrospira sp. Nam80]
MISNDVLTRLLEFRRKRNWEQFHRPKELGAALVVEASELLELFQWKTDDEVVKALEGNLLGRVQDEIADVTIILSYLCHDLALTWMQRCSRNFRRMKRSIPSRRPMATQGSMTKDECNAGRPSETLLNLAHCSNGHGEDIGEKYESSKCN